MTQEVELTSPDPRPLSKKPLLQDKKAPEAIAVPFSHLFRFATKADWLLMILGAAGSVLEGASMPALSLILGNVADGFRPGLSGDQIFNSAVKVCWEFLVVGAGSWLASYFAFAFWVITGERQAIELRKRYFKSLLSQEIAFFDSINPNEFSTKIAEECFNIQQGIGDKVPIFIYCVAMFVTGFTIGYVKGWQLALVLTGFLPFMVVTGAVFVFAMQKMTKVNNEAYSRAGAISEEALNAIRTVVSLGGQSKETRRYKKVLDSNQHEINKYSIYSGTALGVFFLAMFGIYALGFFIASVFLKNQVTNAITGKPYSVGDILTVFFSILMASFTPSRAAPSLKAFAIAKVAAAKAFSIIDRKSQISTDDPNGQKPSHIEGNIRFDKVTFAYPLKPERTILDQISFDIRKNEKTALVGESGCGKTTSMQLIERFYDIANGHGSITLDGVELKDLNLKWMRDNIGYVGQEPVLFATSIRENLLMARDNANDDEIWQALKRANALTFVQNLPDKLDTYVGTNGAMLSGGQKQRLAIARAILKNPKILLLDEATSALDRKNEMEIQKTLDEISEGRTTIVIAHRLSTIINADHIVVFDQGKVVEEGKHEELVAKQGRYYALQHLQLSANEKDKQKAEQEPEVQDEAVVLAAQDGKTSDRVPSVGKGKQASVGKTKPASVGKKDGLQPQEVDVQVTNQGEGTHAKNKGKNPREKNPPVLGRLLRYSKSDAHLIIIGIFNAGVHGLVFPMISIILSNMIAILAVPQDPKFSHKAGLFSIYFLICAIVAFVTMAIQLSCFGIVAERLARKIRGEVFEKYVRMPIGWFDDPHNSPGALGSKLSSDAALLNTLTGSVFGVYCQAIATFVTGMAIAFTASWQLTLIGLGLSPLMIISGKLRAKMDMDFTSDNDAHYQESAAFVSEAVNNMRTVVSFGNEVKILDNYSRKLDVPLKAGLKKGHASGFIYGLGNFFHFTTNAIVFLIGGVFMRDIGLQYKDMFQSIFGIIFAAMGTGNALQFAPDVGSAMNAAVSVFKVLDTKPAIDIDDPTQNYREPIRGDIQFKNIWFRYPGRDKMIFENLNLTIKASTKVALVGPSGCGKSTILALLQRFYDPEQGEVLVDGVNIKQFDLKHLRESFGVVSQEPVLFNGTIEYNIK